jgi:glycine/D-amino acid oxidase-like deaminating enzyme
LVLTERIGLRLPVKVFVHQRYVTGVLPRPLRIPVINANPLGGYVRPASGNRALVGYETAEREEYRVTSTDFHQSALSAAPELKQQHLKNFSLLVPELAHASLESERVGLLMFSMDGEPILGPVAKLPGFYIAIAFHSGGFAYNPAAGLLMAEYVADGKTSIDITTFSPDRFAPDDVNNYLALTIKQQDIARRRH